MHCKLLATCLLSVANFLISLKRTIMCESTIIQIRLNYKIKIIGAKRHYSQLLANLTKKQARALVFWCRWSGRWCRWSDSLLSSLPINSPLDYLPYGKFASKFSPNSRPPILTQKKDSPKRLSIFLVPLVGLASLEPPAKQSTRLFFCLTANTQLKLLAPNSRPPILTQKKDSPKRLSIFLVPLVGLEPTRGLAHWILSPARLPVSPQRRL